MRIFAGPNGSGKSDLAKSLKSNSNKNIKLGIFVNADIIENELKIKGSLGLRQFKISENTTTLQNFIQSYGMSSEKLKAAKIYTKFSIQQNKIVFSGKINSYIAADIASFIRVKLLEKGISFSFETVFSHESKLNIMKQAKKLGFRVYLYFITTDDVEININRVKVRVDKGGHPVPTEKITERYHKSLNLMYEAIKVSDRAYLFDNSGKYYELVAEINSGKEISLTDYDKKIPNWFVKYVYNKSK